MTVLRARADLYGKQVFYCKTAGGKQHFYCTNIAVYLYCYLDGIICSRIINGNIGEAGNAFEHCRAYT